MIELLAIQTATTLALAVAVFKLRRELWPLMATAGRPVDKEFATHDVLIIRTPQFEIAKDVGRFRYVTKDELWLRLTVKIYYEPIDPYSRMYYTEWREWLRGGPKYCCKVKRPRGLERLYSKAVEIVCFEREQWCPRKR